MKKGNAQHFLSCLILSALLLLLLTAATFNSASAKGPILAPPAISLSFSLNQGLLAANLTRNQLSSLEDLTRSIPQLYNSSWKPAITDVLEKNAQTLQNYWLSGIRLDIVDHGKSHYGLDVYVDTTYTGSAFAGVNGSYPIDLPLNKTMANLNGQLYVMFSVTGPYFPSTEQELFSVIDPYFHNLNILTPQIAQALEDEFSGKSFSWFGITLLDQNAVRVDMGGPYELSAGTRYFALQTTETTRTVTATITDSVTTTESSTLTVTQPPQTSTITATFTTTHSVPNNIPQNSNGYLFAGLIIALIGAIAALAIVGKR